MRRQTSQCSGRCPGATGGHPPPAAKWPTGDAAGKAAADRDAPSGKSGSNTAGAGGDDGAAAHQIGNEPPDAKDHRIFQAVRRERHGICTSACAYRIQPARRCMPHRQEMDRVKELGQEAIAITDHGNMYGCIDFYKAAKRRESNRSLAAKSMWRRAHGTTGCMAWTMRRATCIAV